MYCPIAAPEVAAGVALVALLNEEVRVELKVEVLEAKVEVLVVLKVLVVALGRALKVEVAGRAVAVVAGAGLKPLTRLRDTALTAPIKDLIASSRR